MPVRLRVYAAPPIFTCSSYIDGRYRQLKVTLPSSKATHIDKLTLVIEQCADLQTIPLKFHVPIER